MELFAFYNVENLFLPDSKSLHRLNPTKSGLRNWDEQKYQNKLFKIGSVFQLLKDEYAAFPFMFGLSEISGRKVLEDLLETAELKDVYGIVHYNSMDERKVDVALLYDKTKVEILHSEPITFFFEIEDDNPENYDTTRDVLWAKVKYEEQIINVFVLHLPSQKEEINRPKRDYILNSIKEKIFTLVKEHGESAIICGDFNENPHEDNIRQFSAQENGSSLMVAPFDDLFTNQQFSTFHSKNGLLFDQILISSDFLTEKNSLQFDSARVFKIDKLSDWNKKYFGRPYRTYAGTRYLGGYSDHFPVLIKFNKKII